MEVDKLKESSNFKELKKTNIEFVSKVWVKVEELEIFEIEKKEIEENRKIIFREKIKNISLLTIACIFMWTLMILKIMDKQIVIRVMAFLLLTAGNVIHNKVNESKVEDKKVIKMNKWGKSYGN